MVLEDRLDALTFARVTALILYKCPDYHVSARSEYQGVQLGNPISYTGLGSITVNWTCMSSLTSIFGYKDALTGGGLPLENATLTSELSSTSTYVAGHTYSITATIPDDHRLEVWAIPTGTAEYWYTSRWADGYSNDAQELVVRAGSIAFKFWNAPLSKPINQPPDEV